MSLVKSIAIEHIWSAEKVSGFTVSQDGSDPLDGSKVQSLTDYNWYVANSNLAKGSAVDLSQDPFGNGGVDWVKTGGGDGPVILASTTVAAEPYGKYLVDTTTPTTTTLSVLGGPATTSAVEITVADGTIDGEYIEIGRDGPNMVWVTGKARKGATDADNVVITTDGAWIRLVWKQSLGFWHATPLSDATSLTASASGTSTMTIIKTDNTAVTQNGFPYTPDDTMWPEATTGFSQWGKIENADDFVAEAVRLYPTAKSWTWNNTTYTVEMEWWEGDTPQFSNYKVVL